MSRHKAHKSETSGTDMAYHSGRGVITASDGTQFLHEVGDRSARRRAIAAAVERSNIHRSILEKQAGRSLSNRETIFGKHDAPAVEDVPRSNRKVRDPDADFQAALDSVRNSAAHTPAQKQARDLRLAALEKLQKEKEMQKMQAQLKAEYWASDEAQTMVKHIEALRESAERDPTSTPQKLRAIASLEAMVKGTVGLSQADYLKLLDSAGLSEKKTKQDVAVQADVTDRVADGDANGEVAE